MNEKTIKKPALTVDGIILFDTGEIALIQRKNPPFKDQYALPGGFVDYGEKVEDALVREMKEETDLFVKPVRIVGVYSDPNRDPRGHTVSIAYECEILGGVFNAGDDAKNGKKINPYEALTMDLAFDHNDILKDFLG
ncbi:MAG: NUDIX domain-containing protein [Promethearchaeota archaeon]